MDLLLLLGPIHSSNSRHAAAVHIITAKSRAWQGRSEVAPSYHRPVSFVWTFAVEKILARRGCLNERPLAASFGGSAPGRQLFYVSRTNHQGTAVECRFVPLLLSHALCLFVLPLLDPSSSILEAARGISSMSSVRTVVVEADAGAEASLPLALSDRLLAARAAARAPFLMHRADPLAPGAGAGSLAIVRPVIELYM